MYFRHQTTGFFMLHFHHMYGFTNISHIQCGGKFFLLNRLFHVFYAREQHQFFFLHVAVHFLLQGGKQLKYLLHVRVTIAMF